MSQRTDGGTRTYREGALAVAAPEACLVVRDAVGGEEVDEMDGLVTGLALVLRAGEIHGEQLCRGASKGSNKDNRDLLLVVVKDRSSYSDARPCPVDR
jgi:hypothetical protein